MIRKTFPGVYLAAALAAGLLTVYPVCADEIYYDESYDYDYDYSDDYGYDSSYDSSYDDYDYTEVYYEEETPTETTTNASAGSYGGEKVKVDLFEYSAEDTGSSEGIDLSAYVAQTDAQGWPVGPDITSTSAVLLEEESGIDLYEKNTDTELDPGSTVKIMTVLMALENSRLDDEVVMTETGVHGVTDGGYNISAQLDEVFTMEQCLYAIMLASANDVALQVAEHIGGSVENFVQMMNQRAKELGCTNTVFANPTGMADENQHSTAHDMALIMKEAISNEDFARIAATQTYTIPATNMSGGERVLSNNFFLLDKKGDHYYRGCLGGKKGYTQASGSTMVAAARRNDMTVVCSILKGDEQNIENEAEALLNFGFANFEKKSLGEKDFNIIEGGEVLVPVQGGSASLTTVDTEENGRQIRTFYLGDTAVGTAVVEPTEDNYAELSARGEENLKEAREFTENKSKTPYYIIGAIGAGVVLLLIILMIVFTRKE